MGKLEGLVLKVVKVVDDSSHVKVSVLVGKLNSGVPYVTTFGVVVVPPAREHTSGTVHGQRVSRKGSGL